MANYDNYDSPTRERSTRHYYREERRGADSRYLDPQDNYLRPGAAVSSRDLVPRHREDSEMSVEEIHREFPPPGHGSSRSMRRARSAEPGYDDYYDDRRRDYDRDYDRRPRRKAGGSIYYEEEEKKRARMLGKQEKIIAAIAGAALAVGGKELYDRRDAHQSGTDVHRNPLLSAGLGAAGALAGYQGADLYNKHASKEEKKSTYVLHKGRDGRVAEYYSDSEEEDPKKEKGHKNFLEGALAAAGLGGALKALTGKGGADHDDRSDTRSRRGSDGGKKGEAANKIQKAAMASLIAGATEAFRVSKEPGGWRGEKAKRILTAAAGAAAIDSAQSEKHGKVGLAESVIGGLVGNRMINGSKRNIEEDRSTGRSRSRSRARSTGGGGGGGGASGLAALATAGLGALGAKKIMDARSESRSRRSDSDDSRGGSRDRRRSRSRSIVDRARSSLAKMGIGADPDKEDRRRDRSRNRDDSDDDYDDRRRGGHSRGGRNEYDDDDYDDRGPGRRNRSGSRSQRRRNASRSGSESSLGDSDEDEKRAKKMRGKQILTTGLAAVATIHAAHNVYSSMEKRNARHKAVREGRLSPEEAKKLKSKALLQDAASVGIAALGIKGAFSELKEAREMTHECHEWQEEKMKRHRKRLERQKRLRNGEDVDDDDDDDDDDAGQNGRRRADNWSPSAPPRGHRYDDGPRYSDGNPYAALPAPPVGDYDRRR